MKNIQENNRDYDAIAWGALFIWWGIMAIFKLSTQGLWAIGVGLILLGVNFARSRSGLPARHFSTGIAILALVWGGLEFLSSFLNLPFKMPAFEISMLVIGAAILASALMQSKNDHSEVQND